MSNRTLLIGSANREKAAELAVILNGLPWVVRTLQDFPAVDEAVESGATFAENAVIKARRYCERFGVCCVADDSGLEAAALGGAPGVYSARYAGPGCTYADNNAKLLRELAAAGGENRAARFVCCAAFAAPGEEPHVEFGTVEGRIAMECLGTNGFGYDPLFIPEGYEKTFGELAPEVKHAISHRGRAFRALRRYLEARA